MRPVGAGEGVIDDRDVLRGGGVAAREPAAAEQRYLHGREEAGRRPALVRMRSGLIGKRGQVFDGEAAGGLDGGAEGKREDGGCVFDARLLAQTGEQVVHEDSTARFIVAI